ncbi:kelch domain-containing protein 10 homolog [Microplitis demolitor]|uniref:kelch domain-containing protein 10 homolog n=1 Tax=Microplitis demolitor TaxID=69319 RepID=UPI0004CD7BF4|nr:kelch domain-containing protein 10 homolog [Microplitis demolitor]
MSKSKFNPFKFTEYVTRSKILPKCRTEPILYCDGKNFYSFKISSLDLMVFSLETRQWKFMNQGNRLLFPLDSILAAAFHQRKLIILTFQKTLLSPVVTSKLHEFDLDTETMRVVPLTGDIPTPMFPVNFISHENYFYTIGGSKDGEDCADVYRLDTTNLKWECVYKCTGKDPNEPYFSGHNLVFDGRQIFLLRPAVDLRTIFMGRPVINESFTKIPAFDLISRKWKKFDTYGDKRHKPRFPKKERDAYAVAQYDDPATGDTSVIISGGEKDYYVYNDVWKLNLRSFQWTCLEKSGTILPIPVDYHSMCTTSEGRLFLCGGFLDQNSRCGETCTSCSTAVYSVWITVPKLEYLAWKTLERHFPSLAALSRKQIKSLGIPWKFFLSKFKE